MLLGGQILKKFHGPDQWVDRAKEAGFQAVYFPLDHEADSKAIADYAQAADKAGLKIAEVGAWSNPMSPDPVEARNAVDYCCAQLRLADEVGAACCVNIAGSCSSRWDGPHPDNFSQRSFERIVKQTRQIIDTVRPQRTFYTLELMPFMHPDSADGYLKLMEAIDRKQFAVHFDPVNIICSPRAYFENERIVTQAIEKLGPHIKSCHAKDIRLEDDLTAHLNEALPGKGGLDYRAYLSGLKTLAPDLPLMMEHMQTPEQVDESARYLKELAATLAIKL